MAEMKLPASYPATVKMTNLLDSANVDDKVWNTGLSAVGDPHCDENPADAGLATIVDASVLLPAIKKNQTAVAVFGLRNQYWILGEGESVTFTVDTPEAAVYYLQQNSESLSIEVTEGEETGTTAEVSDADSL